MKEIKKIILKDNGFNVNNNWQEFVKVRAIIENQSGKIAITHEAEKIIFPGGKCENDEDALSAIKRELKEELGIDFDNHVFTKKLILETFYEKYYDFRNDSIVPRHTVTTYFYVKTNEAINTNAQNLTTDEINQNFKIFFVDKQNLEKLINEKHTNAPNGKYFDEENHIVLKEILNQ